jgi:CelD/BcsL family acetyltransferase involved in cellulose biosynthesis
VVHGYNISQKYKNSYSVILFIKHEAKLVAGIILFYFNDEVLLYNSGFDPEYFYLSPGVVVVSQAIKDSIEKEKKVFDFLRGNERYKYDLGGADRKLLRVTLNRV